ncbi:hypothetical protein BC940DRAFT_363443 [Gongronella butleri]|nr:hypothetical protein BC940DRAFT_363443 [Gongronella butleri]
MQKAEIDQVFCEAGIDFKPTDAMLMVYPVFSHFFECLVEEPFTAVVSKGLKEFKYENFYEVMFWYNFYTCKKGHRVRGAAQYEHSHRSIAPNHLYLSRIPHDYMTIDRTKGLVVIREAMAQFIERHHGIPAYYTEVTMGQRICYKTS